AVPMMPFIWMISGLSYVVLRCAGIDMNFKGENVTEEDIMSMVNEGHEQGVLEASEAEMITNIFEFTDKEASDIMTHRKNLVVIDGEMTLKDAVTFILKEGKNSRYPVYEKDIDDIVGILHMKDALICVENQENGDQPISRVAGLLREAHFIPETRNINSLFQEMQSQKIHMEIVVDEYGQTAGIVTMEDILEEIVGNILDEYDVDEEYVVPSGEDGYIMSGMTPLDEVAEILGIEFLEEEYGTYDTINGFLISKLDRIPEEDENFEVEQDGYLFK
ncbi:MAG: hemolysin family protein, partial [Hungatella sp.]